jgi:hypothetical protein
MVTNAGPDSAIASLSNAPTLRLHPTHEALGDGSFVCIERATYYLVNVPIPLRTSLIEKRRDFYDYYFKIGEVLCLL